LKIVIATNLQKDVILMANTKKIVGIILLVIGPLIIIFSPIILAPIITIEIGLPVGVIIGLVLCIIGLVFFLLFLRSREINGRDK